jgi:hypothetical protein
MNLLKIKKLRKLSSRGSTHIILPLLAVVLVSVVGTYLLVASHADTPVKPTKSTFIIHTDSSQYKHEKISANFASARCAARSLAKPGSILTVGIPSKGSVVTIECTDLKTATDAYTVAYVTASNDTVNVPPFTQTTGNMCVSVYPPSANLATDVRPRNPTNGSCSTTVPTTPYSPTAGTVTQASGTGNNAGTVAPTLNINSYDLSKTKSTLDATLNAHGITAAKCNGQLQLQGFQSGNTTSAIFTIIYNVGWDTKAKDCRVDATKNMSLKSGTYSISMIFEGNTSIGFKTFAPIKRTVN